jgi:hypothetical protein
MVLQRINGNISLVGSDREPLSSLGHSRSVLQL